MTDEPRLPRMFTDAERERTRRELWGVSQWVDLLEAAVSPGERVARLREVPVPWQEAVAERCRRRAARAAAAAAPADAR